MNVRRQEQGLLFRNLTLKINVVEISYFSIMFHSFRQFDCSSDTFRSQQIMFVILNYPLISNHHR